MLIQLPYTGLALLLMGLVFVTLRLFLSSGTVFMKTAGYVGLAVFALGVYLITRVAFIYLGAPAKAWRFSLAFEWMPVLTMTATAVATAGAVVALIGGLNTRPRPMWIPMIALGTPYCVFTSISSLYPRYKMMMNPAVKAEGRGLLTPDAIVFLAFSLAPGIALILAGLAIRKPKTSCPYA